MAHRLEASSAIDQPMGWQVRGAPAPDPLLWKHFVDDAHAYEGITVCSSEFFAEASDEAAARIVQSIGAQRLHVVVTLRNLGRILPSAWQQALKSGYATPYEPWLREIFASSEVDPKPQTFWIRHRHDRIVRRWAALVGGAHMSVVVVDDAHPDNIYRDFESLIQIPEGTLLNNRLETPNRSMTLAEAEFLRVLNVAVGGRSGWKSYGDAVHDGLIKSMIESRRPDADEPRIATPQWALDRSSELARSYVSAIRESGVHVIGDLDLIADRLISSAEPDTPSAAGLPIDAARAAMLGVLGHSQPQASPSFSSRTRRQFRQLRTSFPSRSKRASN